jgi:hypothetical protein
MNIKLLQKPAHKIEVRGTKPLTATPTLTFAAEKPIVAAQV